MAHSESSWRNGLFSHVCGGHCGTCMGSWFCSPCLFGRTSTRLENFPNEVKDDYCNGSCALMCLAGCCHLHWLPTLLKRGDMRQRLGIKGDGCTDCLASYFCYPCTLAQMETEVKDRAALLKPSAKVDTGYSSQSSGMVYQQPGHPQPGQIGGPMNYQNGHKH